MTNKHVSRTLVVMLHADVAGSTALVQRDETLAHGRITDAFRRCSSTIKDYGGVVHEIRGDALVAEFARVSDAVCAALVFQKTNVEHNAQFSDGITPVLRMGISLGEVIIADKTVTGAGVVLAQRLEQLAKPGGVCIQQAVYEALPRHLPFDYEALGEQQLKGFDEPVRAYAVTAKDGAEVPLPEPHTWRKGVIAAATATALVLIGVFAWWQPWRPIFEPASLERMAHPLPNKPSIAVLPFDNYSDDPKLDFFASGLTEDLTTALSKAPGLFVIARNSVATYKGKPVNVKRVAEEQGVQYVLVGSVQEADDKLRITAQLVDALNGHHVWADRFDRPASHVFAVQDEITKSVLTELQVELTMGDNARIRGRGTSNLEAWLLLLEGYGELQKWTRESMTRSRELFEAAYKKDPAWARPLANVALTHWFEAKQRWSTSRAESVRLGIDFAKRAIELDANDSLGQYVLGNMYFLIVQPERGIELQRKAIALAPNDFSIVAGMAMRIKDFGQEQEAIQLFEHAMRLSPKHPWWVLFGYGFALHLVGRKEEAEQTYKKAIDIGANNARTYARLAAVYVDLDRMNEARVAINEALRLEPKYTVSKYEKAYPLNDSKRDAWYKNLLSRAGLPE